MAINYVQCQKCSGRVGIPTDVVGRVRCPVCDELVFVADADTGVTWSASPPVESMPDQRASNATSSSGDRIEVSATEGSGKSETWAAVCISFGTMGTIGGAFVSGGSLSSPEGIFVIIFTTLLNPLAWLLLFGIWLLKRDAVTQTITPVPPELKRDEEPHSFNDSSQMVADDTSAGPTREVAECEIEESGEQEEVYDAEKSFDIDQTDHVCDSNEDGAANETPVVDPTGDVEGNVLPVIAAHKAASPNVDQSCSLFVVFATVLSAAILVGFAIVAIVSSQNPARESAGSSSFVKEARDQRVFTPNSTIESNRSSSVAQTPSLETKHYNVLSLWSAGEFLKVIESCNQTLSHAGDQNDSGFADALFVRGLAHAKMKHVDDATRDFEELLLHDTPYSKQLANDLQRSYDPNQESFVLEPRLWHTAHGVVMNNAMLRRVRGGIVLLERPNGDPIAVPLWVLAPVDQIWVFEMQKRFGLR